MNWDRVEPVRPCSSPDGHGYVDIETVDRRIPVRAICPRCGEDWHVVVMPDTP